MQQLRVVFALAKKDTNEVIGEAGIHFSKDRKTAEMGYWLGESYWGKDYTTEAVRTILDYGFRVHHLEMIYAICKDENVGSQRVAEKVVCLYIRVVMAWFVMLFKIKKSFNYLYYF